MKRILWLAALLLCLCRAGLAQEEALWTPVIETPLPVISITTADGSSEFATAYVRDDKLAGRIDYVDAVISVSGSDAAYTIDAEPAQVKARGNYTLEYPKKSIRIKFAHKQGMLGLNDGREYRNWVLLADWKDLSMTNNPVAMYLAHAIMDSHGYYVADCRNVEVYINGEYWGMYLLTEQQEVKAGRVELPEPDADYTGTDIGYLFEYDAYFMEEKNLPGGDPTFQIYHDGMSAEQYGYTVKSDITAKRQLCFLSGYVRRVYRIAYSVVQEGVHYRMNETGDGVVLSEETDPVKTIGAVIDLQSLVDMYVLNEIICNPDVGWSSFYITLDMSAAGDGRLVFQAPWDFDSVFGIREGFEDSQGLFVPGRGNPWFDLLCGENWFREMVRKRWQELTARGVQEQALTLVEAHREVYKEAYERNLVRWISRVLDGNHELIRELNLCMNQSQASAYLQRWLGARFAYLNSVWLEE